MSGRIISAEEAAGYLADIEADHSPFSDDLARTALDRARWYVVAHQVGAELVRAEKRARVLREQRDAVLALHKSTEHTSGWPFPRHWCVACESQPYPCPTVAALGVGS